MSSADSFHVEESTGQSPGVMLSRARRLLLHHPAVGIAWVYPVLHHSPLTRRPSARQVTCPSGLLHVASSFSKRLLSSPSGDVSGDKQQSFVLPMQCALLHLSHWAATYH